MPMPSAPSPRWAVTCCPRERVLITACPDWDGPDRAGPLSTLAGIVRVRGAVREEALPEVCGSGVTGRRCGTRAASILATGRFPFSQTWLSFPFVVLYEDGRLLGYNPPFRVDEPVGFSAADPHCPRALCGRVHLLADSSRGPQPVLVELRGHSERAGGWERVACFCSGGGCGLRCGTFSAMWFSAVVRCVQTAPCAPSVAAACG